MTKELLLIGDFAGVGKVSFSVMTPILTKQHRTLNYLPTAVVSNSFDYGDAVVQELTEFMKNSVNMWQKHNFQFDLVTTGFLFSPEQVAIIQSLLTSQKIKPFLIADPIMGDLGELYAGLTPDLVKGVRAMLPLADLIIPNLTEALLILGEEAQYHHATEERVFSWLSQLHALGAKSILITSIELDGEFFIFGYHEKEDVYFKVPYQMIPIHFGGTGDIFTSLMVNELLENPDQTLQSMVERSAKTISDILMQEEKRARGIINEVYLQNYLEKLQTSYLQEHHAHQ